MTPDSSSTPEQTGRPLEQQSQTKHQQTGPAFTVANLSLHQDGATPSQSDSTEIPDPLQFEDYYELLGVTPETSQETIQAAAEQQLVNYHPDNTELANPYATDLFIAVQEARDVLTSTSRRSTYDTLGHEQYVRVSRDVGALVTESHTGQSQSPQTESEAGSDAVRLGTESTDIQTSAGYSPGEGSRTKHGQAVVNGGSLLTENMTKFYPANSHTETQTADAGTDSSNKSFTQIFDRDRFSVKSRSSLHLEALWKRSWLHRTLAALLGAGLFFILSVLTANQVSLPLKTGISTTSARAVTAGSAIFLCVAVLTRIGWYELQFPRGLFVEDTRNRFFAETTVNSFLHRGTVIATVPLVLTVSTSLAGQTAWTQAIATIHGDTLTSSTGGNTLPASPWVAELFPTTAQMEFLNVVFSLVFLTTLVLSLGYFAFGLSAWAWYARFVEGYRTHPLAVEAGIVLTASAAVATVLIPPPIQILSISALERLPQQVQLFINIDNGVITQTTFLATGYFSLLTLSLCYGSRLVAERRLRQYLS